MDELHFNMSAGYFEGLLRGFRAGILKQTDYINLSQCDTLDGNVIGQCEFRMKPIFGVFFFF